jgi:hypothetical protein
MPSPVEIIMALFGLFGFAVTATLVVAVVETARYAKGARDASRQCAAHLARITGA